MLERWQNQEEAYRFGLKHPAVMLDMDMGTGKTRVAIDLVYARPDCYRVLIVCPKSVVKDKVWKKNLEKFAPNQGYGYWDQSKGSVKQKAENLEKWLHQTYSRQFVVINYDSVWRKELGELVYKSGFNCVILDESHRAKSAGSKVSKYLAMLGKRVKYKMCLSGTPMANSPLDVYGQYRFLDPNIYGTRHDFFLDRYAIKGGPDLKFIVGYKNQQDLNAKFRTIAYTCKMEDVADKIKLPPELPSITNKVELSPKDYKTLKELQKEFVAECGTGHVVVNNVLVAMLRMQQICSGFCVIKQDVFSDGEEEEVNTAKADRLLEYLEDISPLSSVVVFCVFRHDLGVIKEMAKKSQRRYFELSGSENTLEEWKKVDGAVIGVQIQAGSEGVDMTKAHHALYYSIPHSLAQYNQSKARLYRPGQEHPVSFTHLIAEGTVEESMYESLERKEDIIESIKMGTFNFGYTK